MQWKKRKIHPLVCRFGSPVWQSLFYYWYSGKEHAEMGKNSTILSERAKGGNCSLEGSLRELAGYRMKRAEEKFGRWDIHFAIKAIITYIKAKYEKKM